jgi:hypothetical protein
MLSFAAQLKLDTSLVGKHHDVQCSIPAVFSSTSAIVVDCVNSHASLLRNTLGQVLGKPVNVAIALHHDAGTSDVLQLNKSTGQSLELADDLRLTLQSLRDVVLPLETTHPRLELKRGACERFEVSLSVRVENRLVTKPLLIVRE